MQYNVIKFQSPFEKAKLYSDSPEITLYRSIILQAVIDVSNNSFSKKAVILEKEAKKWLFEDNEDFIDICNMAEVNKDYIRKIARDVVNINKKQDKK